MVAKFIAEEGLLKGLILPLDEGDRWVLGRDPEECQLIIEDPAASRQHMICRSTPEGFMVENLSDTNPVMINEEEVSEPKMIKHGDTVTIGNGKFRFYTEGEPLIDLETNGQIEEIEEEEERDSIFEEEMAEEEEKMLAEVDVDLTETSTWLLKVIAGPNNGAEYGMEQDSSYILGSDPAASDIIFQDVSVSRKHAKVSITNEETIKLEDLSSSNGTNVEGKNISGEIDLIPNTVVSIGTTSFIVYNVEGEHSTVVSPLLPAIAKVIQESERKREEELEKQAAEKTQEEVSVDLPEEESLSEPTKNSFSKIVFTILTAGIVLTVGIGITQLFRSEEIVVAKQEPIKELDRILSQYSTVTYSYTKETGRLLLVGHILTNVERNQLIYSLNVLPFIDNIDDKIVVDEFIWGEINQVIAKNPNWRGVSIHSPSAGQFVISGYLETRQQAEMLNDYLNQNFPYIDLLQRRVIVEEDVESQVEVLLQDDGFDEVTVSMDSGDTTLRGSVPYGSRVKLDALVAKVKKINGVRTVKAFVSELPIEQSFVNISDRYKVTGSSVQGKDISVVIKGRILSIGDILDGMVVTDITPNRISLERGDVKYVIDYN